MTATEKITKAEAEKLWRGLADAFESADKKIKCIIDTRAWEPLGYDNFIDAWNERIGNKTTLGTLAKAHVVWAFFDGGATEADVVKAIGVGDETASRWARERKAGVPASAASPTRPKANATTVRQHERAKPSQAHTVKVELTPEEYKDFTAQAKAAGVTLEGLAANALRNYFNALRAVA